MKPSLRLESHIQARVTHLDKLDGNLISCRTVVEKMHGDGDIYMVKVELLIPPRHQLVVVKNSDKNGIRHDPAKVVIDEAFDVLELKLKKLCSKLRQEVKVHAPKNALATVESLKRDHGFLRNEEGDLVYFHRNSVKGPMSFFDLRVGMQVDFAQGQGTLGPQARFVSPSNALCLR